MSIDKYEIALAVQNGELLALKPRAPGAPVNRALLLSKTMQTAVINGPWKDKTEKRRLKGILRADLERFVTGAPLRLSLGGPLRIAEDMKRLQDAYEVWEFKSDTNKPRQGIRVFGRFAMHNVFITTHWQWRDHLGNYGSSEWDVEIDRCTTEWANLFQKHTVHTGDQIDAYLSDAEDAATFY